VWLHGDLHFKNFLADNFLADARRLALIDLDTMRPGLPWCDLGSLAASLIAEGLSRGRPGAAIQRTVAVLCDAYRARVEWTIGDEELAWFIDAALLYERAARCVTRLKPGAWALLAAILDWVGAGRTRVRPGPVETNAVETNAIDGHTVEGHTVEMHAVATRREVTRS